MPLTFEPINNASGSVGGRDPERGRRAGGGEASGGRGGGGGKEIEERVQSREGEGGEWFRGGRGYRGREDRQKVRRVCKGEGMASRRVGDRHSEGGLPEGRGG